MNKVKIFLSILFAIAMSTAIGLGAYFTIIFVNKERNHKFESAYIYDETYSRSINAELESINAGESATFLIPLISKLDRTIIVNVSINGTQQEINKYLMISFDDQDTSSSLYSLIENKNEYSLDVKAKETKNVEMHYSLKDDYSLELGDEYNFSINIFASDVHIRLSYGK